MKTLIFLATIFIINNFNAQISNEITYLVKYLPNSIKIESKYKLIPDSSNYKIDKHIVKHGKYVYYKITPITAKQTLFIKLKRKGRVFNKNYNYAVKLIKPDIFKPYFKKYPTIDLKFNASFDFNKIKIALQCQHSIFGQSLTLNKLKYDVEFNNSAFNKTTLVEIRDTIITVRPKIVKIYNFRAENIYDSIHPFYSTDTLKLVINYPSDLDTSNWCFDNEKQIVKIKTEDFKPKKELTIVNKGCLHLTFEGEGSENDYTITNLKTGEIYLYQYLCCDFNNLIDFSHKYGVFKIEFTGDGYIEENKLIINIINGN